MAVALIEIARELHRELHPRSRMGERAELESSLETVWGFDSLSRAELLLRVERAFGIHLPEHLLCEAETLDDLLAALRGAKAARLLVVGTYRNTELGRTHPLAETLAELRRDADAHRISLSGLAEEDIDAYLSAIGIDDRALGRELAEVTSGNPFFLIEVLRHVEETGGTWAPGTLPEGVRDATGRRLARLSDATNAALSIAAACSASHMIMAPRGPRRVLCVVVTMTPACPTGVG